MACRASGGAPVGADERAGPMRSGAQRGDGDTFFGCNFLSAPATERFDQSLNPLLPPIPSPYMARLSPSRVPSAPSPPHLYRLAFSTFLLVPPRTPHGGYPPCFPPSPCRPISPPYRCSITFAMHFFPSSFFIKLDYNCIASSSCGIAGRKNGTLPGMRVHPRSTGPRGRERKEGGRGCGRANDRFWRSGARRTGRRGPANGWREGVWVGGKGGGWGASSRRKKPMRFRGRLIGSRTYTYSPSTNPTVRVLIFAPLPFVAPYPPRVCLRPLSSSYSLLHSYGLVPRSAVSRGGHNEIWNTSLTHWKRIRRRCS